MKHEARTTPRLRARHLCVALLLVVAAGGCEETAGPQWVDSLQLQPDSLFLLPGESADFGVLPVDQHDNPLPERASRVEWQVSNPGVASLETTEVGATVTAVVPGATFVRVELGRGTGTGAVYVEPEELSEIRIEPSPVEVTLGGGRVSIRAILVGLDGNEVSPGGYRVSWGIGDINTYIMVGRQEVITGPSSSIGGRRQGQASLRLAVGDRLVTTSVIVR